MSDMPPDPFVDDTTHHDDACVAMGVAVLDLLTSGHTLVAVTSDGEGGWTITGGDL